MAIKLRKKGVFLTFISVAIIAAIIIIFTPSDINLKKDLSVIKTRVSNVNDYVIDLESVYLERTLKATGTKAIISLIFYVDIVGPFPTVEDFENAFSEVLLSGTINGDNIDGITLQNIMEDNTYNDWLNKIITTAQSAFNVDTTFNNIALTDIQVYQISPWFVNVDADITLTVNSETASWNKNVMIKTEIEIENFNDPYYLINTDPNYENIIRRSGNRFDDWDKDKVNDFIADGNYTHWQNSQAPSFIQKFTNDLSSSDCCGIESIVDPDNSVIADQFTSYVDYLYWSTTPDCDNLNLYTVSGIDPEVKFDFSHIVLYNLVADSTQICPPE